MTSFLRKFARRKILNLKLHQKYSLKRSCMAKHSTRDDNYDQLNINALFESLFAVSDSALIDASFDDFLARDPLVNALPFIMHPSGLSLRTSQSRFSLCLIPKAYSVLQLPVRFLTGSCLSSLSANGGVPGSRLRSLHLHRITMKDKTALSEALLASLSVCHSLVELTFVGMMDSVLSSFSGGRPDLVETWVCKEFVVNCPKITTLVLQACELFPSEAFKLVK
ncbi:unnamed protein product [Lactuca saligna]|uniref:Uncharacterized protein n=1 Tax=Lactuca saligna TaxID=75948 RepID=A0AA36EIG6_LACSI|nr:unnamed protein product [Lactuca saligna]